MEHGQWCTYEQFHFTFDILFGPVSSQHAKQIEPKATTMDPTHNCQWLERVL